MIYITLLDSLCKKERWNGEGKKGYNVTIHITLIDELCKKDDVFFIPIQRSMTYKFEMKIQC